MMCVIKNVLFFLAVMSITHTIAQEPVKDLSIGNKWFYQQSGWAHGGINLNANITFEVIGDTLIDNTEYAILLENYIGENGHTHIYRFYEMADSSKTVVIYPCQQGIGWVDEISYDFSMNIGDTIYYKGYSGYNTIIEKGDSIYWLFNLSNIDIITRQCRFDYINTNFIHIAEYFGMINLYSEAVDNAYNWILRGAIIDGLVFGTTDLDKENIVGLYLLKQNYPNPFNSITKINYKIAESGFTSIKICDVLGSEVATLVNKEKPAGNYEVVFNATALTSGIYFCQLRAGNFVETKKMVLLK